MRANRCAIGARVRVDVEEQGRVRSLHRTVGSGGSCGANPLRLEVGLGKEWWVGDRWGIGVAGQFSFGSNQDQGSAAHWKTISPALAFSASFQ